MAEWSMAVVLKVMQGWEEHRLLPIQPNNIRLFCVDGYPNADEYFTPAQHRQLLVDAGYADVHVFEEKSQGWICAIGTRP